MGQTGPGSTFQAMGSRLAHAFAFAFLISSQFFLRALPAVADDAHLVGGLFVYLISRNFIAFASLFLAVAVVQAHVAPGWSRWAWWLALLTTLVAANVASALWIPQGQFTIDHGIATREGLALENTWTFTVFGAFAIWYYESVDRAARADATLHEQELARRGAELWMLETRLGILQARLDPDFLFDALDRATAGYRTGRTAGEAALAELIDHLRLALPKPHAADSDHSTHRQGAAT